MTVSPRITGMKEMPAGHTFRQGIGYLGYGYPNGGRVF